MYGLSLFALPVLYAPAYFTWCDLARRDFGCQGNSLDGVGLFFLSFLIALCVLILVILIAAFGRTRRR